jgi:magnesium transporter
LRQFLVRLHFADLAEVLESYLSPEEAVGVFVFIAPAKAAEVLPGLSEALQQQCVLALPAAKASRLIRQMPADDAVDLLQSLLPEQRRNVLGELPLDADTRSLHQLLSEEPDTAAGLMSTEFVKLPADATVEQALHAIKQSDERTFVYYVYLIDREEKLVGVVSLKKLIMASQESLLNSVASFDMKTVLDTFDEELVVKVFRKYYNLLAMPVVDANDRLLGLVTLDDVVDVIEEQNQEERYKQSGIVLDEEADERNLLHGPVLDAVKARLPWLSVTVLGQLVTASIIGFFQPTVAKAVLAFSFLPLLCGLAGNIGTQSDTITVRGLALSVVREGNIRKRLWREVKVASLLGGVCSLVIGLASFALYRHPLLSGLLMGFVFFSACLSASLGMLLPYAISQKLKLDPAGVGGPFITTSMDLLMYTSYLGVLTVLLQYVKVI